MNRFTAIAQERSTAAQALAGRRCFPRMWGGPSVQFAEPAITESVRLWLREGDLRPVPTGRDDRIPVPRNPRNPGKT